MSTSELSSAPWNTMNDGSRDLLVTVSVTLVKTVKVSVKDYAVISRERNEDGEIDEELDFSDCDLREAVEDQIVLPQDVCPTWAVDDFEVDMA